MAHLYRWLLVGGFWFASACGGQKSGELCQRDSDCEAGLTCTVATGKCQLGSAPAAVQGADDPAELAEDEAD